MGLLEKLRRDTIASRVTRINLLVSALSLFLACVAFLIYDQISVRNTMISGLASEAGIISANSASAIMFDDPTAAATTLAPVKDIPNIQAAEIRLPTGVVFSRFSRTSTDSLQPFVLDSDADQMHWSQNGLLVYGRRIVFTGRYLGSVFIASDLTPVRDRLWRYLGIALLVFVLAFVAAVVFSRGLRKSVSTPIEQLANVSRHVSSEHDFSLRVPSMSNIGELAQLTSAFNDMLVQLQLDEEQRKRAESALIQSEKLAATGRMAATMAHEINNPLESVTNLLFLARKDAAPNSKGRKYLQLAEQELERIAHLAKQTLGFYRDSSSAVAFNTSEAIEEILNIYARRIASRNVKIEKELDPDAEVVGFAGEFRQVVSNLLVNAADAMSENGGRLLLRTRTARRDNNNGVIIVIADTGKGIPKQNLAKIFEAFFTTKQNVGTGLGLWLTRGIVEKHGGKIRVRSCVQGPRRGTVFSIFWPKAKASTGTHGSTSRTSVSRA